MIVISSEADIKIDRNNVYRNLGYSHDSERSGRIVSLVEEYSEEVQNLIEPAYSYVIRDILWIDNSRVFAAGESNQLSQLLMFESDVIARLLERCSKVAVFLVTIDNRLEEMSARLAEDGLILQASVLDAIGSEAAEKMADSVQDVIGEKAREEGMVISRRFSPGYCDWDIIQQRMVFRAIRRNTLGVYLTDTCLMIPQKSISGIIGIGPPDSLVEQYNPCITCDKLNCPGERF